MILARLPKCLAKPVFPGLWIGGVLSMSRCTDGAATMAWRGRLTLGLIVFTLLAAEARSIHAAPCDVPWWLPGCSNEWETFAVFDSVFMQRDNLAAPNALIVDGNTLDTAIDARDMQFAVAPGARALYGQHGRCGIGWEVGYLGVYGMHAVGRMDGDANLQVPLPLAAQVASLRGASLGQTTYNSVLSSAEANFLVTDSWVHLPRNTAYEFERIPAVATVDWIVGARWAGLDEAASIQLVNPTDPMDVITGNYDVRSTSNLIAAQIGSRGRIEWQRWAIEGWLKAGLAGAILSQSQDPIVDAVSGDVFRDARSSTSGTVGGIFDLGTSVVYRFNEVWGLRVGYSMLWLTGVALAPDQFDFSANVDAGTALDGDGTIWLGGGTLGLEAQW